MKGERRDVIVVKDCIKEEKLKWDEGMYKDYSTEIFEKQFNHLVDPSGVNKSKRIGNMNSLIKEFKANTKHKNWNALDDFQDVLNEWRDFYNSKYASQLKEAKEYFANYYIDHLPKQFIDINEPTKIKCKQAAYDYIDHLVYYNTIKGFMIEMIVLKELADKYNLEYRKSTAQEDADGIDGFIDDDIAVSIKPYSYDPKKHVYSPVQGSLVKYKIDGSDLRIYIENQLEHKLNTCSLLAN